MPEAAPNPTSSPPPTLGRFWTRWTIVWLVGWVALFTVTHVPLSKGAHLPFRLADKVVHFTIFFTLALLGSRSAVSRRVQLSGGWLLRWSVIYALYAAADELLQPLVGRNDSFGDWLADALGAAAGLATAHLNQSGREPSAGES